MKIFTKIKHWQFFLILILLHCFVIDRLTFLIISTTFLTLFSFWIYSIVIIGQQKLLDLKIINFNIRYLGICCFFIPLLWIVIAINPATLFKITPSVIWYRILIILLCFTFIICWIYSIYLASKTIKTIEVKNYPKVKDYILIILGFIIWPIGIWLIQPKVNKICA